MNAEWRWDFAIEILPQMLWATLNTILAAGIGYAIATIVGLLFLLGQRTPIKIVNMINREVVEFIRSTPLLIQLFVSKLNRHVCNDFAFAFRFLHKSLKCEFMHWNTKIYIYHN